MPSPWRAFFLRCAAIVVGVLAAGVIAEVGLRLGGYERSYLNPLGSFHQSDPVLGYRGKPNFSGRFRTPEFDALVVHDANGFRRQEHQHPLARSRHQVLVFGNSFTWGWGVSQGEMFTDQMSLLLPDYHVRNFGLSGSGTVQHLAVFNRYGKDTLRPGDTVVLAFFGNDFNDNLKGVLYAELQDGVVRLVGPTKQVGGGFKDVLKDYSYLMNLIIYSSDRIGGAALRRRGEQRWASEFATQGDRSPEIIVANQLLGDFQRACIAKQAHFVIAYIPGQGELGEATDGDENRPKIEAGYRRALFDITGKLGIPVIDLLPHFLAAKRGAADRLTFVRDEHWTARAHALAARAIAEYIVAIDR